MTKVNKRSKFFDIIFFMNIVFIRHSQSLVNPHVPIDTWGLSKEGIALAKQLQKHSDVQKIQVMYASLQPKAIETALFATKNKGTYLRTDDRLTEITSFTKKFQPLDVLEKNTKAFYSGNLERLFGGESKDEALKRFHQVLEEISFKEKEKEFVGIVSHGAILAFFAAQYTREDPYEVLQRMKQPDIAVFHWETKKFTTPFGLKQ